MPIGQVEAGVKKRPVTAAVVRQPRIWGMRCWQLVQELRSYYRGCHNRDLREFYDLESRLPYFDHVSQILGAHKRRILLTWIGLSPVQGPILELGSGIGTFARQLGRRGYQVVGVDISAAKTHKAQRLTARQWQETAPVHHLVGDLRECGAGTALDLEVQKVAQRLTPLRFDVLLAADVLEHIPEPPHETLRRIHTLLAPQGRFFTSVPSRLWVNDPGHFWRLLPREWEQHFMASGFHIQRRQMSRLCWYGLPTPLPLAMVYELHPRPSASG
jgi:2-polyprenyl-3-methyl-5-hydroxy-6-metoxy-1,4-benzoquinol methylase